MKMNKWTIVVMGICSILFMQYCKSVEQPESIEIDEIADHEELEVITTPASEPSKVKTVTDDTYKSDVLLDEDVGIRTEKMLKPISAEMMSDVSDMVGSSRRASDNLPAAGQITAGEWNDLQNWKDWLSLIQDGDYIQMQSYWGIYPEKRISVFITNATNQPVAGAEVHLTDLKGTLIWKSLTDHGGHAELWPELYKASQSQDYQIRINYDGEVYVKGEVKLIEQGTNNISLPVDCNEQNVVDIMFVVDATGSMGDEITFLKSELNDVLQRVTLENHDLTYRTGAVFYRDHTDDYLTQVSDLSIDKGLTTAFIAEQSAKGGGDYPEAVEAGLEEALAQDWSEEALSKIIFLLLDAPPHKDTSSMHMIKESIAEAASLGIKIIPITASGINRETEFLMKYIAILTNATYVFITDDSGIGNAHLDPVVKDYEVEKLNDLLYRLIANYTRALSCHVDLESSESTISLFPNPSSNRITIQSDDEIIKVEVLSNSGKVLIVKTPVGKTDIEIGLDNLIDGIYQVAVYTTDGRQTRSVIKVSG